MIGKDLIGRNFTHQTGRVVITDYSEESGLYTFEALNGDRIRTSNPNPKGLKVAENDIYTPEIVQEYRKSFNTLNNLDVNSDVNIINESLGNYEQVVNKIKSFDDTFKPPSTVTRKINELTNINSSQNIDYAKEYDDYIKQKINQNNSETDFNKQVEKEWRTYQGEEAKRIGKEKKAQRKEQRRLERERAEKEAQEAARIKEAQMIENQNAKKEIVRKQIAEKEYNDLFHSEEYKKYDQKHTALKEERDFVENYKKDIERVKQGIAREDALKNNAKNLALNPSNSTEPKVLNNNLPLIQNNTTPDNINGFKSNFIKKQIDDELLVKSYLEWDDGNKGVADTPIKATKAEDIKIEYDRWANNGKLSNTTDEVQEAVNKAINSSSSKQEAIEYLEQNFRGDTKHGAKRIINDTYEYAYESVHINKRAVAQEAVENSAEEVAKNLKKSTMKNLGHAMNLGFGIMDYKDSREAGKSVAGSLVHAGAEFAKGELLGGWYMAAMLAKSAPSMAVSAAEGLNTMARSMNSTQRRQLFGDSQFMDTQQLATMRQSGMELAKMSQYNLQQTLMGNEAEYLHRL